MDTEKIKSIIKMFEESQISKMDLTDGDMHITLEKDMEPVEVVRKVKAPVYQETETKELQMQGTPMKSPLVGTYYQASGTDQSPFVKVGDHVNVGDTICIIEAMKVMNEIPAPKDGVVTEILVENEEMVEFGKGLVRIK